MTQRYYNPFANIELVYPVEQRQYYERYCQTGTRASVDESPFPRMVDLWFTGLALAARERLSPVDLSVQTTSNFITGSIFDREDSWRVQAVMLVAIAIEGHLEVVGNPRRVMSIGNGLAAAGVPRVVEMLTEGNQPAIWNLSDALEKVLDSGPD